MEQHTRQEKLWQSTFGEAYTNRNRCNPQELDELYTKTWGVSRSAMNKHFLGDKKIDSVLEVGCNTADQLVLLQNQGYSNLYGIEIQDYAFELAKKYTKGISLIRGSALDLPFKNNCFDLVFTSGVLIHVSPDDITKVIREVVRVSKRYIWCFEYYSPQCEEIAVHGEIHFLWKANFAKLFQNEFPQLTLLQSGQYKYRDNDNTDEMFILQKP